MVASFTDPGWRQDSCQWLQSSVSGSSLVGKKSFSLPTVESLLTRFLWAELGHVQVSEPVNSQGKECADWPGGAHAQTLEPALLHSRGIGALGRGLFKGDLRSHSQQTGRSELGAAATKADLRGPAPGPVCLELSGVNESTGALIKRQMDSAGRSRVRYRFVPH